MVDVNTDKFKSCLKIVTSQTNYDEKTATEKLIEYKEDFITVIKEYLNQGKNIEPKKEEKKSINQRIITEIRKFKDKQDRTYLSKKENVEKMKKLYELHLNKKTE